MYNIRKKSLELYEKIRADNGVLFAQSRADKPTLLDNKFRKGKTLMAKIISLANQKGGVGKTTSCVNVAASLGLLGHRVLIIHI